MKTSDNSLYTKRELLNWINDLLQVQVHTIEQLSNGAVFCQLVDVISPGCVRMQKVNWNAKLQHESLANLKILSTSMLSLNIQKKFEVTRISQKKTQDILELLQWFRKYFLTNHISSQKYDASNRRRPLSAQKNSSEHRTSLQITRKTKQFSLVKPLVSSKQEYEDIIKDTDLKQIVKINKQIERIIIEEPSVRAEQKLDLIKRILFSKNIHANHNDKSKVAVTERRQEMIMQSDNQRGLCIQSEVKLQYVYTHTPSLIQAYPQNDLNCSKCSSQILSQTETKQQQRVQSHIKGHRSEKSGKN